VLTEDSRHSGDKQEKKSTGYMKSVKSGYVQEVVASIVVFVTP
jgi:hypothetical protein